MKTIPTLLFSLFLSLISYSQTYVLWMVDQSDPLRLKLRKTTQTYAFTKYDNCVVLESPALYIEIPDSSSNELPSIATVVFSDDTIKSPILYYTDSTRWMAIIFKPNNVPETRYWFHFNDFFKQQ